MVEDLTRLWGNLSLNEGEIGELEIQPKAVEGLISRGKHCLVEKLLAERFVGKQIIKHKFIKGWRPSNHLSFKVLGENMFLVEFENECDKIRVLEGRPWIFEGSLFSVEDFDGLSSLLDIDFEQAVFWVRMLNLPLACMGKEVGYQIGATMGKVEEVDADEEGVGWGKYLRVRIRLNLIKPLVRVRIIKLFGNEVLIAFQYKKLPRYCFDCGKISHGRDGCSVRGGTQKRESEKPYGPWLRARSPRRRGEQNSARENEWQWTEKEKGGDSNSFIGKRRSNSVQSQTAREGGRTPPVW
ncbi:uncharacterized protein LOC132165128 [Corylus avellana]|uniref:uncharacterized protein LOC132165128 n=1 Tax=Corylus avellana TaxID=13451 RepID=UPI00286B7BDD|nr:uncharacterized protein LOC132165128 [Corylus avellana]